MKPPPLEIAGQARLDPCVFCGEPSVEELEVISEVTESKGDGVVVQVKRPVVHPVCALHAQHIKEGAGWQQRMKDSSRRLTVEAKKRLARDQGRLW